MLGTLWETTAQAAAPFAAEVWEATVDSTAPDHTTDEAEDMRVEVVAVVALDGEMVLVLEQAGHERPSRDVA